MIPIYFQKDVLLLGHSDLFVSLIAMASAERDPERVYYRAGGFEQSRPILKGADAKETFEFVPIVDVSNVFSPDLDVRKKLATEIGRAVREVGFFYAVNPPVATKLMGMEPRLLC